MRPAFARNLCLFLAGWTVGIVSTPVEYVERPAVITPAPEPEAPPPVLLISAVAFRDSLVTREVDKVNAQFGRTVLPVRRMLAVARVENRKADPRAVSSAGAVGLMQVHARLWQDVYPACGADLYDPQTNVCYGVRIMLHHLAVCEFDWPCALAGYNGATTPAHKLAYRSRVAEEEGVL